MNPELHSMLLAISDRAEELGAGVVATVLRLLAARGGDRSLRQIAAELELEAMIREAGQRLAAEPRAPVSSQDDGLHDILHTTYVRPQRRD